MSQGSRIQVRVTSDSLALFAPWLKAVFHDVHDNRCWHYGLMVKVNQGCVRSSDEASVGGLLKQSAIRCDRSFR